VVSQFHLQYDYGKLITFKNIIMDSELTTLWQDRNVTVYGYYY